MKKFIIAVVSVFVLVLTMNVAFARERNDHNDRHNHPDVDVDVDNYANIVNDIDAKADTGDNRGGSRVITGNAFADAMSETRANRNDVLVDIPIGAEADVDVDNEARVNNSVNAIADTGDNSANNVRRERFQRSLRTLGSITTGDATAYATAMTIVNDSIVTVE